MQSSCLKADSTSVAFVPYSYFGWEGPGPPASNAEIPAGK